MLICCISASFKIMFILCRLLFKKLLEIEMGCLQTPCRPLKEDTVVRYYDDKMYICLFSSCLVYDSYLQVYLNWIEFFHWLHHFRAISQNIQKNYLLKICNTKVIIMLYLVFCSNMQKHIYSILTIDQIFMWPVHVCIHIIFSCNNCNIERIIIM